MPINISLHQEWLEADGLGGYASGTAMGVRTRRYRALLLTATTPPTGRVVLVTASMRGWKRRRAFDLSSQCYAPGVIGGEGAQHIESFTWEPWPKWVYSFADGRRVQQELFAVKGEPVTCLAWNLLEPWKGARLFVLPFPKTPLSCAAALNPGNENNSHHVRARFIGVPIQ